MKHARKFVNLIFLLAFVLLLINQQILSKRNVLNVSYDLTEASKLIKKVSSSRPIRNLPSRMIQGLLRGFSKVKIKQSSHINLRMKFKLHPMNVMKFFCKRTPCVETKDIKWSMVMFVKSTAHNFHRRDVLRRTWASVSYVNGGTLDTVFVMGSQNVSEEIMALIKDEQHSFGDILQYDGPDNYENIGLKTLAGMQWAIDYLPSDYLYSSVDDDFLIDLEVLTNNIKRALSDIIDNSWPSFPIICGFVKGVNETPIRHPTEKWYIPKKIWKWSTFPPYCHGGLYTTSVSVVNQLFDISRTDRPWYLDDVWLTGILRRKLQMPDDMVIGPLTYPGVHHAIFHDPSFSMLKGYIYKIWDPTFKAIENSSDLCICNK